MQAALAMLAPEWGFGQLIDIADEQARDDLARASVMALSFVAQSARGSGRPPVPQSEIDKATSIPERFLIRWRGEADPEHVKAIDAYWISAAEHGMNASTFTARVVASTGADVAAALSGAVGALSGPLHGGAPSRVLQMLDERRARWATPSGWVKAALDRGERLMGFGHRVYRAEDPRARVLRRTSASWARPASRSPRRSSRPRSPSCTPRKPDRVLATNVEFWSAVVLDLAEVPPDLFTPHVHLRARRRLVRHILEQKREGRLIRPTAKYVGPQLAPGVRTCPGPRRRAQRPLTGAHATGLGRRVAGRVADGRIAGDKSHAAVPGREFVALLPAIGGASGSSRAGPFAALPRRIGRL